MGASSFRAEDQVRLHPPPNSCGEEYPSAKHWWRIACVGGLLALITLGLGSCSGSVPPGVDRALPSSTYAAQEAVLRAWVAGERQFYAYMDEPDARVLREFDAGMSPTHVFSNAQKYATGAALASELSGLRQMKLRHLIGPKTFDLGHPVISSFSTREATVSWCATDSGTTTPRGTPGPLTLDGGSGGSRGTSTFMIFENAWKAIGGHSISVSQC